MAKVQLNKAQKAISIIVAVILAVVIACGVYCISTDQSPVQAVKTVFTSNENQIIGKWQSQKSPGLSAYVFYDDGTYDSYLSTVNFSGEYTIKGNKLTLNNPNTMKEIVYTFSVNEKTLTIETYEEDGEKSEDDTVNKYDRVDELNQKSLTDLIGELAGDENASNTEE
ncbi:MAG: DUF5640 domain-containing protein [Clostridium sp.]|nr:DUF5640 domain-containing protein [Clostridium sp.]